MSGNRCSRWIKSRPGRAMGLLIAVACLAIGASLRAQGMISWGCGGGALLLIATVVWKPEWLHPIERGWLRIGATIAYCNTVLILTMVYALILTPLGICKRLLFPDARFQHAPSATTRWVRRSSTTPPNFHRLF